MHSDDDRDYRLDRQRGAERAYRIEILSVQECLAPALIIVGFGQWARNEAVGERGPDTICSGQAGGNDIEKLSILPHCFPHDFELMEDICGDEPSDCAHRAYPAAILPLGHRKRRGLSV